VTVRAVLLGAGGQVGHAVRDAVPPHVVLTAYDRHAVDITDRDAITRAVCAARATVVINCAAYTRVDDAEREREVADAVNASGPGHVGAAARAVGARVVHVSTDYVFDGDAGAPYAPDAAPAPRGVYATSKRDGERRLLAACPEAVIVRTGWVHGGHGPHFVRTAVRVLRAHGRMEVVDDQIGTPTHVTHLAGALWRAATGAYAGHTMHFTDSGVASWYDVALCVRDTMIAAGALRDDALVVPVPTHRVTRPAPRPRCGVLDKHASWATLAWTPAPWRDGVITSTRELLACEPCL
jgi:dTDP-4-dehydrorhamnose reductase